MRTPEQITEEILKTVETYVSEWFDSSYEEMKKELLDTVTEICKEDLKPGLPEDCVMGETEIKFCSIRNGDGWQCKKCAN
jgi:hypothetical protein